MSTRRELEQVAELAPRICTYFTATDSAGQTVWDRIGLCMSGHPKAASWDNGPRSDPAFCWNHQQDVSICHNDGHVCFGDPMSGPSDPTGEAALKADRAADVERQCHDDIRTLVRILERLEDAGSKYPPTRPANAYERGLTATANDPHCESCSKVEITKGQAWWVEPRTKERTTHKGMLDKPMWLCDWCENHVDQTGLEPSVEEVEWHKLGKKVFCKHPRIQKTA